MSMKIGRVEMIKEFIVTPMPGYPAELEIRLDVGYGFSQPILEMSKDGIADTLIRLGKLMKRCKSIGELK